MKCSLCGKKKAKRYCPAKKTDICPTCCGEKRGVEINCPPDCRYFVGGRQYQESKVTKRRLVKEGAVSFARRARLYNRHPGLFEGIEKAIVSHFRGTPGLTNDDLLAALDLVLKTLDTEKSGLIYEHKSGKTTVDDLVLGLVSLSREVTEGANVKAGRLTIATVSEVFGEFRKELEFYVSEQRGPRTYLAQLARYHPAEPEVPSAKSGLIIT